LSDEYLVCNCELQTVLHTCTEPRSRMEAGAPPTTVAELLSLHELDRYAAAFDEHGWDSLKRLLAISEPDLHKLISDVQMKSGHQCGLRAALGKPAAPTATAAPTPPAVAAPQPPPPPAQQDALQAKMAAQLYGKLAETDVGGIRLHGTTIETWANPANGEPTLLFTDEQNYLCRVCPTPKRSQGVGTRTCGRYFTNVYQHLGSEQHWKACRHKFLGLPFDHTAWYTFTQGNQHGPARVKTKVSGAPTAQAAKRAATTALHAMSQMPTRERVAAQCGAAQARTPTTVTMTPEPSWRPMPPPDLPNPMVVTPGSTVGTATDYEARAAELQEEMDDGALFDPVPPPAPPPGPVPPPAPLPVPATVALPAPAPVMAPVAAGTMGWAAATMFATAAARSY
jgi:hypothetical protein